MPKRVFEGIVVSDKMQKNVVVAVEIPKNHPTYNKILKNTKRFKVRNTIDAKLNDVVLIEESRPYSKEVTWVTKQLVSGEQK